MAGVIFLVGFALLVILVSYLVGKKTKPESAYDVESHKYIYGDIEKGYLGSSRGAPNIKEDSAGTDTGDQG